MSQKQNNSHKIPPLTPLPQKKNKKTVTAYDLDTMWPLHSLKNEFIQQLWFLHKAHRTKPTRSIGIPAGIYRTQRVTKQKPLPTKQRNQKTK